MSRGGAWLSALGLSGVFALLFTHFLALSRVAGFHYDEAWAALFARRIFSESSFWPLQAMSPYTSAWSHYVAALCFKLFGASLLVFRGSGIALVVLGIVLFSAALKRLGEGKAAAILPWVVAFFPAAVFNHRFAIEINTFHVFCLGLLCWGAALSTPVLSAALICLACLLGTTSHVLFLAPALAAFAVAVATGVFTRSAPSRALAGVTLGALFLFFLRIHLAIPEKDKSLALLALAVLCAIALIFPASAKNLAVRAWERAPRRATWAFLCGIVLVPAFFLLFFSEGTWSASFFSGRNVSPFALGWPLLGLGLAFAGCRGCIRWRGREATRHPWLAPAAAWAVLTTVLTAALATKPAPRYFEIPLLLLSASMALALARASSRKWAIAASAVWILGGSLQLALDYWGPGLQGKIAEQDVRFLFFHDSTSDTLPKQELALALGRRGCAFSQVDSDDIRILDPLRFLASGDWPVSGTRCELGERVRVARISKLGGGDQPLLEVGPFAILREP